MFIAGFMSAIFLPLIKGKRWKGCWCILYFLLARHPASARRSNWSWWSGKMFCFAYTPGMKLFLSWKTTNACGDRTLIICLIHPLSFIRTQLHFIRLNDFISHNKNFTTDWVLTSLQEPLPCLPSIRWITLWFRETTSVSIAESQRLRSEEYLSEFPSCLRGKDIRRSTIGTGCLQHGRDLRFICLQRRLGLRLTWSKLKAKSIKLKA